jgi:hypothetical protein
MGSTAYYTSHSPYTLTRINSNWEGFRYEHLNGTFINTETGVTISTRYTGEKNYAVSIGNKTASGLLIAPGKMLVNNYVLNFEHSASGATHFLLNADRIQQLRFTRTH